MAVWQRAGTLLIFALAAGAAAGCATSRSQMAAWTPGGHAAEEKLWSRAQACETKGQLAEAQRLYQELAQRHPTSARAAHRLGVVSTQLGDDRRAQQAYQRARDLEPNNPDLLADMGYAAYLKADYSRAEELLRASLAQKPDNPRAVSNLALAVGFQGRYDECLVLFRRVHGRNEAEAICNLAYVRAERGETSEAADLYRHALKIDPSAKKASLALAQLKPTAEPRELVADGDSYRPIVEANELPAESYPTAPVPELVDATTSPVRTIPVEEEAAPETSDQPETVAWAVDPSEESATPAETNPPKPFPVGEPSRAIPVDAGPPRSRKVAKVRTVTSDEKPFAVTAESPDESLPRLLSPGETRPVEVAEESKPEQQSDAGIKIEALQISETVKKNETAKKSDSWLDEESDGEPFGPGWLRERQAQIAERKGQAGLMGFCPVALRDEQKLVDVQAEFWVEHRSQTYQFSSSEAAAKFAADPQRYLPAAGGDDVVATSQGTLIAEGSLEYALWFRHKLYLFVNQQNMELFRSQCRQFAVQQ